ncbi:MAG: hypothetical protein ACLSE9_03620 [Acutalibacteraceae bacterium]
MALSSLTRLRENGKFVDKWMGLFHERDFVNYKTVLSFSKDGKMMWTKPEPYFSAYRDIEKKSQMCEVECVRSDMGRGDELMLITRSNSKRINSLLSFSRDEGKNVVKTRGGSRVIKRRKTQGGVSAGRQTVYNLPLDRA